MNGRFQTQQTPETMQEEAPAPEAKPEEKMPAAPETEPGQEASAVGLSEIFFLGDGRGFGGGTGRGSAGIFL
ncbi:MAG: hypothetical protein ACLR8U_00425 [Oscillospiraceae bacterium]